MDNDQPLILLECRYGSMLSFKNDSVIGRSLQLYGEWAEHELSCLKPYIRPGSTVVDVGANIGTHTLAFSQWVADGEVVAIEGQPLVSGILSTNCFMNQRSNVQVVNAICSTTSGWLRVRPDYTKEENVGAVSFRNEASINNPSTWRRITDWFKRPKGPDVVPIRKLDDIVTSNNVSLIKLDIEGMELDALRGASRLLRESQPVLYMEQLNTEQLPQLYKLLSEYGYNLFWLETHPFNQNNYRGNNENIWWKTEAGLLGISNVAKAPTHLNVVDMNNQVVPNKLDARIGIPVLKLAYS